MSVHRPRRVAAMLALVAVFAASCDTAGAADGDDEAPLSFEGISTDHVVELARHSPDGAGATALTAPTSGACQDPWVTQAVTEVTGVTPVGHVCNIRWYGDGRWSSYADLVAKVRSRMRMCGDIWVTQAVIEATGQLPTSYQCNINLYGNGHWSDYADLYRKVSGLRANVVASYHRAFGRDPSDGELRHWMQFQEANDVDTVVGYHRWWLQNDPNEAHLTAGRVLARLLGDRGNTDQLPDFAGYREATGKGFTYDELLQQATYNYVAQAFERIFRYRNDPGYSPVAQTAVAFDEAVYREVYEAVKGVGRRRELRLPSAPNMPASVPADADGIWSYVALHGAPVFGSHKSTQANAEKCVGGIGSKCEGVPIKNEPRSIEPFTRMDGTRMHYVQVNIAVGSIWHDYACQHYKKDDADRQVVWCQGPDIVHELMGTDPLRAIVKNMQPGAHEWNKAVWNTFQTRSWVGKFGPYPVDAAAASTYQDDIRPAANRYGEISNAGMLGGIGSGLAWWAYTNGEHQASTVLHAPTGTALDASDAAYCASGRFASTHTGVDFGVPTRWGICA